jgi:NADPH2:quinone reductase
MRLTEGRGTDLVVESVGGDVLLDALGTLAPFGRIVVLGSASNTPSLVHSGELFNHNRSLIGFGVHQYFPNTQLIKTTVAELVDLIVEGRLRLRLDHVLPLSAAAQAHRLVEERRSTGKVVLQPWATTSPGIDSTGDRS